MKNLVQIGERRRKLNLATPSKDGDTVVDLCRIESEGLGAHPSTVVLTRDGILAKVDDDSNTIWTSNLDDVEPGGEWFHLAYIDPELVCLSRNGAILTVSPATGEAESVGVFDYGVEAACWSPDGEVLLMVTSAVDDDDETKTKSVLMTMNTQFEVLAEVKIPTFLPSRDNKDAKISVTWRPDGSLCAMSAVDHDDMIRKCRIYKRETLELHAIGRAEDASGTIVKNLQDTSLGWAGPGCSQLLSTVQRKGKKTQQVVFFESNGLRHREFSLREAPATSVTSLTWNVTSDLLAVALREDSGTDKIQLWHRCNYHWYMKQEFIYPGRVIHSVQFHEEKAAEFCVLLDGMEWREYEVRWDPSSTFPMSDQCPAFVVDGCSLNITPLDKALIPPPMSMNTLVLDKPVSDIAFCHGDSYHGSLLLRLSGGNMEFLSPSGPATYDTISVKCGEARDGIAWNSLRSTLVVGEHQGQLHVLAVSCGGIEANVDTLVEIEVVGLGSTNAIANMSNTSKLEDRVLRMQNWSDNPTGCLIELADGTLLELETSEMGSSIIPSPSEPLLEPCPWLCAIMDASPFAAQHSGCHPRLVFGLSGRSHLYFHDMMLSDAVSSFFLSTSHEFLCYATAGSRCFLRFLPLKEVNSLDPLMGMDQNHLLEGYEPRSVERGARIVAILPGQPMAVMQMPRGNLEGVYPRALVLRFVMLQIAQGQYGEAFRMMRKHKVDLNLLVDFDPWFFSREGIAIFLKQVPVIDHLNLFLSGLQDWDATQGRFPVPMWLRRENQETKERSSFDFSNKVNLICSQARATMTEMEQSNEVPEGHFLLPVLSTFAKESPPKLSEALALIRDRALEHHNESSKKPPLFADKAQKAIQYLAFLAEYELLFETTLGMYDYDLARAVARNSQMDPKVYLPLLKRLNAIPKYYSRYEVDVRLKRYEAALTNLFESYTIQESIEGFEPAESNGSRFGNSFDDCMALIETEKLHSLGLKLFRSDKAKTRTIIISLGKRLLNENEASAALSIFFAAEPPCLEEAKIAARSAGDWRTFFTLASAVDSESSTGEQQQEQAENRKERSRQIAREIATEMVAKTNSESISKAKQEVHANAARILLDYGVDLHGAVDILLKAQCWHEARRISNLHGRVDLEKKCIDSAIEFAHLVMDEFHEKSSTFDSTGLKYMEVLKLRKKNVYEGDGTTNDADETGSLFSTASNMSNMSLRSSASTGSSVSSIISIKTTTTFTMTGDDGVNRHRSKFNKGKKQKANKKKGKQRRKPGSEEELNGLVFALKSCCPGKEYAEIVSETIRSLVMVGQHELASEVFKRYNAMQEAISKSQAHRTELTQAEKKNAEQQTRVIGEADNENHHILVELAVEKEVDALSCAPLYQSLSELFDYLAF